MKRSRLRSHIKGRTGDFMPNRPKEMEVLDLLTRKQVADGFGVTVLTIITWQEKKGLPFVKIPGSSVQLFRRVPVRVWAHRNGKFFRMPATGEQL